MNISGLNDLPVELFHYLLGYFSAREILYTFTRLTSYIDAILKTFMKYRVDFNKISRRDFDLICRCITPDQIIALTVSNDEYTPGLIGLFLSRFRINQFTRLRALKLIDIGPDFSKTIIRQMIELKHLRAFYFFSSNQNESTDDVAQFNPSLFHTYAPLLTQLYQLRLSNGDLLESIQFPYLRHLILEQCTVDLMKHISSVAPQLYSLDTSFSLYTLPMELIYPLPKLNRLILRIEGINIIEDKSILQCLRVSRYKNFYVCSGTNAIQFTSSETSSIDR